MKNVQKTTIDITIDPFCGFEHHRFCRNERAQRLASFVAKGKTVVLCTVGKEAIKEAIMVVMAANAILTDQLGERVKCSCTFEFHEADKHTGISFVVTPTAI